MSLTGPPRNEVRPSRQELRAAAGKTVPDIITPGLRVLFCGINPGLYSGAVGHHFARPGNRFWKVIHAAGFTPRLLAPFEESELPALGVGITNLVERATASAAELTEAELHAGRERLVRKIALHRPAFVAVVGIDAFRKAFREPRAKPGKQTLSLAGATWWVLPNPSGLNASYQFDQMVTLFQELYLASREAAS